MLDAKAAIDGVPMTVDLVEPVGADSPAERKRVITGTIPSDAVAKFAPGLDGIVSGPIGLDLTLGAEDRQVVKADLQEATVSLPWIGWSKGRGIPALLTVTAQARDGVTSLSDLKLSGDNFGASGGLTLDKAALPAPTLPPSSSLPAMTMPFPSSGRKRATASRSTAARPICAR